MKKKILGLFFASFLTVSSFGQEIPNAIFVDFGSTFIGVLAGGFGIGLGYERGLADNFSALVNASYIGAVIKGQGTAKDAELSMITAGLHARYYPQGYTVGKWFFDVSGNYYYVSGKYGDETATSNLFEAGAITGWKFVFGDSGGFFLEPGLGFTAIFGNLDIPSGWSITIPAVGGVKLWLGMGWAF